MMETPLSSIGGLNDYSQHNYSHKNNNQLYSAHGSIDVAGLTVSQIADKLEQ